ncbi:hypothetical protein [Mesorhizobium sp.]|uniref:hypothetical protein n=1 Tax=Mesorhizobium sp. TaxID=1871066 RepID=UPI000FE9C7E2|nr:hypothetical protein [Mesorhizobium sp.]RWC25940.1 MAG: hypothetical protein EOS70_32540 [Mesorhizobium sp.]RWE64183.1 MAG: hypothetical protein EOS62_30570 [Mesorhizobium sp.]RWE91484.1 MAG: hypothetical protein EOS43_32575 [Mesorhizobium sp.]TIS74732.1 MAG: hypothetical protein E5W94_23855 [Mesorhizobium sp.]TIU95218.1 MAG: hypothetical protein E5W01_00280 [Mesorhizobium sp.]
MARASIGDKGELEKLIAATKESYERNIHAAGVAANVLEDRRKVLESIAKAGDQLNAYPVVMDTPYLIWASPIGMLVDSRVEPGNNWAKVEGRRQHGSGIEPFPDWRYFYDTVSFHYFWDNPSAENYALVNVASTLVTKGSVVAKGYPAILNGGTGRLRAITSLILYQGAAHPAHQAAQEEVMYKVEATAGGLGSGEKSDTKGVFYEASVEYKIFPIPPGTRTVFEVRLTLESAIWPTGSTSFDFASAAQDNYVKCPSLVITVLAN